MNKKFKIFTNYILGPAIFIWFSVSIYKQIIQQKDLQKTWNELLNFSKTEWAIVIAAFLLMFLNWGLETKKWQILIRGIEDVSFFKAFRAVFGGQAFALNTVNNLGEYVGRVLFLSEGNRLRGVSLTMVGSMSQVLVTFIMGFLSLFFSRILFEKNGLGTGGVNTFWYSGLMFVLLTCTVLLTMVYFSLSWITKAVEKLPFISKYAFLIQKVEDFAPKDLTKILVFSFLRYVVFVVQYLLLLKVFKVEANMLLLALMVCVFLLILAIVPTIALTEVGLRGQISIQLIGLLSANTSGIVFAATAIWLINRVFPALAGSLFMLGIRLFKRQ
ncbi:MAG: lysylphosphatidylglycerol synthase domain-containing protein [Chitinophagaceae bacterium]